PQGKILTVDIDGAGWRETTAALSCAGRERLLSRITFLEGSSTAPEIVEAIRAQIPSGAKVLVLLDSLHTKAHVLQECRLYGPLVSPGSYLIVNDTHLGTWYSKVADLDDPLAAVNDFLAENSDFKAESVSERFVLSCAHRGFLKKVK